jgi:hypothetical protein
VNSVARRRLHHLKKTVIARIVLLMLLLSGLFTAFGCDDAMVRGGANVVLEGVNVGSVSMEGKPVAGLPSQAVNVVLKVSANEVRISTSSGKTTIKLNPSGATVVISPDGTTFSGVKSDQVEIQWQTTTTTTK